MNLRVLKKSTREPSALCAQPAGTSRHTAKAYTWYRQPQLNHAFHGTP